MDEFLYRLPVFKNLTSLLVEVVAFRLSSPEEIVLPRLRTLQWAARGSSHQPRDFLVLPSLVNLSIVIHSNELEHILEPYGHTLKALVVEAEAQWLTFPPWEFYPHLEELAVLTSSDHEPKLTLPPVLPANHPFRHIWSNTYSSEVMCNLVRDLSSNLKKITISPAPGVSWARALCGETSRQQQICEQRGLVFESQDVRVSDWNGTRVRFICPPVRLFPLKMALYS